MRKFCLILLTIFFILSGSTVWAGQTQAIIWLHVDLSAQDKGQATKLWLPYPVSTAYQDIDSISIRGDYDSAAVYNDKKFQNPILAASWAAGTAARHLSFSFKATRQEVQRRDFPAQEVAWDPADYALWLAPTRLAPVTGSVRDLAGRIVAGKTSVLARAKAIYDWTCENMYRDPATIGCGKGDVCALLQRPGGKCTDIHSVFVALCRAAGVPAREIFGIRMGKALEQDISGWQHCWAEFYLPGYGWVPVDPADVRKLMLKKNLKLTDPATAQLRHYFWGGWDSYRIKLAIGRDIILSPRQQGPPLNTLGYPYAEVGGVPLNWYDPASFRYTITSFRLNDEGYGQISSAGLQRLLASGDEMVVVDARSRGEFDDAHIPGAVNVPVKEFANQAQLLPQDKGQMLIFYCNGVKCGKSKRAARQALAMGYGKVLVYNGGLPDWEAKGLPLYTGADYQPPVATKRIEPAVLAKILTSNNPELTVVDVRSPAEFQEGHINGAINMPLSTLGETLTSLPRSSRIIVYCNGGGRSAKAYGQLIGRGFQDVRQLIFADWRQAGLPVMVSR